MEKLTNKEEEGYLVTDEGKITTAATIYRAFRDYKLELEGIPVE